MRRVFHVLFFCCVFYTRQIGNYVYFIVFFHGYFVRDGMDDCTSLRFALLSPFAQQSDAEARLGPYQSQASIYWIAGSRFHTLSVHFHINYAAALNMEHEKSFASGIESSLDAWLLHSQLSVWLHQLRCNFFFSLSLLCNLIFFRPF